MSNKKVFEETKARVLKKAKEAKKKIMLSAKQKKEAQAEADKLNWQLQEFIDKYAEKTGEKVVCSFISIDWEWYQKRIVNSTDNLNSIDWIILTASICWLMLSNFK